MSSRGEHLGEFEQLVLSAVLMCGENAYGTPVHETLEELVPDRVISLGAIYATLDRLEEKGLVSSRFGEPTPERGGRAKRFFKVEAAGMKCLKQSLELVKKIRKELRLAGAVI